MDIWRNLGITSNNSSENYCFEKASLLYMQNGILKQKHFSYSTVADETYQETNSIMNMDYTARAKTIFTPFYWLPFCKGARVRFSDGEELTIKTITLVTDSKKAQGDGKGYKGVNITF